MIVQEISRAVRNLTRAPRFCVVVIVTLALAVGGAGGLFSLLDAAALRTLPVRAPEQLVAVWPANGQALFGITMPTLAAFVEAQDALESVCGVGQGSAVFVEVGGVYTLRAAESVTGECAEVLGLEAIRGRLITAREAPLRGASESVVVVGYRFWQSVLQGAPDVVGRTLHVEGQPLTIVGVLPESYRGINADESPDVVLPMESVWRFHGNLRVLATHLVARLRPAVTVDEARVRLRGVWPEVWKAANPGAAPGAPSRAGLAENLRVEGLARGFSLLRDRYEGALRSLVALAALLVLLACANVGALVLARTVSREPQLATQMALGASRSRLVTGLTLEGMVLALCSATLAVPLAWWTSHALALTLWTGSRPLTMEVTPATATFVVIAATGFIAGLLVSLPSALAVCLRQWQLAATTVRGVFGATHRWRRALIAGQVAMSLVLLFCAALFTRNLSDLRQRDLGYTADGLRFARLDLAFGAPGAYDYDTYFRTLVDRVSSLPQVESAALAVAFPTSEVRHMTALFPIARDGGQRGTLEANGTMDRISPGLFHTSGIRLLEGREFSWQDTQTAPAVAILTAPLAESLFPDGDAVGSRIRLAGRKPDVLTVVGVVADFSPGDPRIQRVPRLYVPMMQEPGVSSLPSVLMRVRTPTGLLEALRAVVEPLGRHQVSSVKAIDDQIDRLLTRERVLSGLGLAFAAIGILIGALGLYAVLAHAVTVRRREMGLRIALGASRRGVLALVAREGVVMMMLGVAIGLPLALAGGQASRALLFELSPYDGRALATALVILAIVCLAAVVLPAVHAARTDPATALRSE